MMVVVMDEGPDRVFKLRADRRSVIAGAGGMLALAGAITPPAFAQPLADRTIPEAWQRAPAVPLWPDGPPGGGFTPGILPEDSPPVFQHNIDRPYLRLFRPSRGNGRALLVIPGGAYTFVSIDNEGVDVGKALSAVGYTIFVLVYRLPGEGWANRADVPLQDAQRSMRLIRSLASRYDYDPAQVGVLGFSAGGHLAASLVTGFAERVYIPADAADRLDARPFAAGLVYPVISMTSPVTHAESRTHLLGVDPRPDEVERRSPALQVSMATPPTFLVHALDDPAVPPENSIEMMQALRAARRPVEAHFFEEGGHGFGLGPADLPVRRWPEAFAAFLDRHAARR